MPISRRQPGISCRGDITCRWRLSLLSGLSDRGAGVPPWCRCGARRRHGRPAAGPDSDHPTTEAAAEAAAAQFDTSVNFGRARWTSHNAESRLVRSAPVWFPARVGDVWPRHFVVGRRCCGYTAPGTEYLGLQHIIEGVNSIPVLFFF